MGFFNSKKHEDIFDEDLLDGVEGSSGSEDSNGFFSGTFKAPHALTADELLSSLSMPQNNNAAPDKPQLDPFKIEMDSEEEYSEAAQLLFSRMMGNLPDDGSTEPAAAADYSDLLSGPATDGAAEPASAQDTADGDVLEDVLSSTPEGPEASVPEIADAAEADTVSDESPSVDREEPVESAATDLAEAKDADEQSQNIPDGTNEPDGAAVERSIMPAKKYTAETADELLAEIKRTVAEKTEASGASESKKDDSAEIQPANNFTLPEVREKLREFLRDEDGTEATAPVEPKYALASVDDILRSVERKARELAKSKKEAQRAAAQIKYIDENNNGETAEQPQDPAEQEAKVTKFKKEQVPIEIDVVKITDADESDIEGTRPVPLTYQYSYADEDLPNADTGDGADAATMRFDLPTGDVDPVYAKAMAARDAIKKKFKLDDPEEETGEDEKSDRFADYTCVDDAMDFNNDLKHRIRKLTFRIVPTAVIAVILTVLSLPGFNDPADSRFTLIRIASVLLMGIAMVINFNTVSGIVSVFRGESDLDTPVALAAIAAFAYNCIGITSPDLVFLGAPVAIELLFCNVGKLLVQKRTLASFEHIANSKTKNAVKLIDEDCGSAEIANGAGLDAALICGSQPAVNITDFFKRCYAPQPYERLVPATLICSVVIGIISGAVAFVLGQSMAAAVGTALLVLCAFCPPAYCLTGILPYSAAAKKMLGAGAVTCGLEGAMNIADANSIVFNADRLFPAGTVNLYQMKVLSPNPIDLAIVEAAEVAKAAKSPLADMFSRMAEGRPDMVSDPVDSINLEGKMGISGWIKDRRILIGNRLLMETHGIAIPAAATDRRILEKGYFPVYIACAGVACALFVVGYNVDKNVKYELQRLSNAGVTVLVNSTDPNITEEMICDYFGIYRESVRMLNAKALNEYKKAVNYSESVSAPGVYSGDAVALASMLTTSTRLRKVVTAAVAANVIGIAAAALLLAYGAFAGAIPAMPALWLSAYQLLCLAVHGLISFMARA